MQIHVRTLCTTVAALAASAPLYAAQPADRTNSPDTMQRQRMRHMTTDQQTGPLTFMSVRDLKGVDVKNAQDNKLGDVNDLIIDRGSGEVRYIVLKSGTFLGMGGRLATIPYSSFQWSTDKNDKPVLTLNESPEQIKALPKFDKSDWEKGAGRDTYINTISRNYYDNTNSPWPQQVPENAQTSTVTGTVKSFDRQTLSNGQEQLTVVVSSPGHPDHTIVLGPSWYLSGNNSIALYRDAPITLRVFQVQSNGQTQEVARTVAVNGNETTLYNNQGQPVWTGSSTATTENNPNTSSQSDVFANSPLVLSSEIIKQPVDCRGEKCGRVDDLVLEPHQGRIAFLSIKPDRGYLGTSDDKRLVPFTLLTRSAGGTIHLDASKAMLAAAPTTPSDIKSLSTGNMYQSVYNAFDIQPGSYRHTPNDTMDRDRYNRNTDENNQNNNNP